MKLVQGLIIVVLLNVYACRATEKSHTPELYAQVKAFDRVALALEKTMSDKDLGLVYHMLDAATKGDLDRVKDVCKQPRSAMKVPVKRLKNDGTDIDAIVMQERSILEVVDRENYTPLMRAAAFGHVDVARWLVQHGADIHARNVYGTTAHELALKLQQYAVADYLNAYVCTQQASKMQKQQESKEAVGQKQSRLPKIKQGIAYQHVIAHTKAIGAGHGAGAKKGAFIKK